MKVSARDGQNAKVERNLLILSFQCAVVISFDIRLILGVSVFLGCNRGNTPANTGKLLIR